MKKISIIIPCYNVEKYLPACLYSVLHQTFHNIEVIAIDDKSTDKTWDILKKYQKEYPRKLRIYQNEMNKGVSYCRNLGVSLADGDYIGFVDSDDVVTSTMYESFMKAVKKYEDSNIEVYSTGLNRIESHEYLIPQIVKRKQFGTTTRIDFTSMPLSNLHWFENQMPVWNKLFTHDLISSFPFLEGRIYEDVGVTYPLLMKAKWMVILNQADYYYRKTPKSITYGKNIPNEKILDLFYIYQDALKKGIDVGLSKQDYFTLRTLLMECLVKTELEWMSSWYISDDCIQDVLRMGAYITGEFLSVSEFFSRKVITSDPKIKNQEEFLQVKENFYKRVYLNE